MYLPEQFQLSEDEIQKSLEAGGFGHLITPGPDGLEATSIPMMYNKENHSLVAHVTRPNPHWKYTQEAESLVILPRVDAYVTPEYYPSKYEHQKVVPTWNYESLYIYGQLEAHDSKEWLYQQITDLTNHHEKGRSPKEWKVTDAPDKFIKMQMKGIVGIEIHISRILGKAKLNQNRSPEDRTGVIRGLEKGTYTERATAEKMVNSGLDNL